MLKFMMKNLSAEYVFGGYSVRKNTAFANRRVGSRVFYDRFIYTYIDTFLSFYILMEDGTYMNVETNDRVPLLTAEDLISKHLKPGEDFEETYDREKIIGVFGVRKMDELIKQVDELNASNNAEEVRLKGIIEPKKAYMGMEITATISSFNKATNRKSKEVLIPPIKYDFDDEYESVLGDEIDYFDFVSNKDSDTIIDDLIKLNDSMDGVGNLKE